MMFDYESSLINDNEVLLLLDKDDLQLRVDIRGYSKANYFSILNEWLEIKYLPITNARDVSKTVSDSCLVVCFILLNT